MRVLVCGGRDYDNKAEVFRELSELRQLCGNLTIITGGAPGADDLARLWALRERQKCITEPADWDKHGKAAGPIRNQLMIDKHKPEFVLAFPGGRGTADMVRRARDAGIETRRVRWDLQNSDRN